ncbi:hypothetical protein BDA99DRAFT_543356 [Phascolomyces articulosus]|uniref:Uncharacterized protein n=1 Tax=Phascolomyces articulosus TaxID=60185 RepID=A0AAD5P7U9_9FUNG|nr:hypothetical protein BDA99DRAFT_543356 [Phascolomyces articulosus]
MPLFTMIKQYTRLVSFIRDTVLAFFRSNKKFCAGWYKRYALSRGPRTKSDTSKEIYKQPSNSNMNFGPSNGGIPLFKYGKNSNANIIFFFWPGLEGEDLEQLWSMKFVEGLKKSNIKVFLVNNVSSIIENIFIKIFHKHQDEEENSFLDPNGITIGYLTIKNNMKNLISYGIIDIGSRADDSLTKQCVGKMHDKIVVQANTTNDIPMSYLGESEKTVKAYICALVKDVDNAKDFNSILNNAKTSLNKTNNNSWIRMVLKLAKVKSSNGEKRNLIGDQVESARKKDSITQETNNKEAASKLLTWPAREPSLQTSRREGGVNTITQGAAAPGSVLKTIKKWQKQFSTKADRNNERPSKGTSTDGIISHGDSGLEIAIIEASGPPEINNHTHLVEDRRKIAINLKKAMKKTTQCQQSCTLKNSSSWSSVLQTSIICILFDNDNTCGIYF